MDSLILHFLVSFVYGFTSTSICLNGLGSCFVFLTLSSYLLVVHSLSKMPFYPYFK